MRKMRAVFVFLGCWSVATSALALDEAEILSRRVPGQRYVVYSSTEFCVLQVGGATWGIPLWACDPATLKIIKVIGGSAPAPYAVEITTRRNDPIEEASGRTLSTIHLLAASLEDAVRMRRAIIREIEVMQRAIEQRQGKPPGYLSAVVRRDVQGKTPNEPKPRTKETKR